MDVERRFSHSEESTRDLTSPSQLTMAEAQDTSIGIPNAEAAPQEFTWATCTGLPDDERIWIKEQAASAGLAFCEQLVSLFEAHNISQVSDERPALGKQHLQAWSQDLGMVIGLGFHTALIQFGY